MRRYGGEKERKRQFLSSERQFQVSAFETGLEEGEIPETRTQDEEQLRGQKITFDLRMAMFQVARGGEVWNSGDSWG